jgi:hypothetical protein
MRSFRIRPVAAASADVPFALSLLLLQILFSIAFIRDAFQGGRASASASIPVLSVAHACQLYLAPSKGEAVMCVSLPCPALPFHAMPCLVISYPALPCPTLSFSSLS